MFPRPPSPGRAIIIGACGVLFGVVLLPFVFSDFTANRSLQPLIVGLIALLWLLGSYFILLGSIWSARDRGRS
jgi:membrane associated rhomboid family serine protease